MSADRRLDRRVLEGTAAVIGVTWTDQDDNAVDAPGTPDVSVARFDGTVVHTGTAVAVSGTTGRWTTTLPLAATALLDRLTATWTAAGQSRTTVHDVAGGWYFNPAEAELPASLNGTSSFALEDVLRARIKVEDECEWICGVPFVPRFLVANVIGDGSHELQLTPMIRAVRSVTVTPWLDTPRVWTSDQVAQIRRGPDPKDGRLFAPLTDPWTDQASIVIAYEAGYDRPDPMLRDAALRRLRTMLFEDDPRVWDADDDEDAHVTTATDERGPGPFRTGDPFVDAVYARFSLRQRGPAAVAASRPLVFDNQRQSLFHGRSVW